MKNVLEIYIILILAISSITSRVHVWRIRKNYNKFITKQQEGKNESDLSEVVNNLHGLFEVQDLNQMDYVLLIIFTLIVIIKNKGGLI